MLLVLLTRPPLIATVLTNILGNTEKVVSVIDEEIFKSSKANFVSFVHKLEKLYLNRKKKILLKGSMCEDGNITTSVMWVAHNAGESGCVCLLLFYTLTTVFKLYHGRNMMYEMRRRKP